MSSAVGAALLSVALTTSTAGSAQPELPRSAIERGLAVAGCTLPASEAAIIGSEHLSRELEIVEVACWRAAYNSGSILFAVPRDRPQAAELVPTESWRNGQVEPTYRVSSPGFDPESRTLSTTHLARRSGDCGTIQEMAWTGWRFRLLNVWRKDQCDGEPFEWDSREEWQVFPQRAAAQPNASRQSPRHERADTTQ